MIALAAVGCKPMLALTWRFCSWPPVRRIVPNEVDNSPDGELGVRICQIPRIGNAGIHQTLHVRAVLEADLGWTYGLRIFRNVSNLSKSSGEIRPVSLACRLIRAKPPSAVSWSVQLHSCANRLTNSLPN